MYLKSFSISFGSYWYSIVFIIITSLRIIKKHITSSIYLLKINVYGIVYIYISRNLNRFFYTNILSNWYYSQVLKNQHPNANSYNN